MCDLRVGDAIYKIIRIYDHNTNQYLRKVDESTMYIITAIRDETSDWHAGYDFTFIATIKDVANQLNPEDYIVQYLNHSYNMNERYAVKTY